MSSLRAGTFVSLFTAVSAVPALCSAWHDGGNLPKLGNFLLSENKVNGGIQRTEGRPQWPV